MVLHCLRITSCFLAPMGSSKSCQPFLCHPPLLSPSASLPATPNDPWSCPQHPLLSWPLLLGSLCLDSLTVSSHPSAFTQVLCLQEAVPCTSPTSFSHGHLGYPVFSSHRLVLTLWIISGSLSLFLSEETMSSSRVGSLPHLPHTYTQNSAYNRAQRNVCHNL